MFGDGITLILVIGVSVQIFCIRKQFYAQVVIQMSLMILVYLARTVQDIYDVTVNEKDLTTWYTILYSGALILWFTQHWIFTGSYLSVAMTFKLAFKERTPDTKA